MNDLFPLYRAYRNEPYYVCLMRERSRISRNTGELGRVRVFWSPVDPEIVYVIFSPSYEQITVCDLGHSGG